MKILIHDYAGHPFQVGLSRELAYRGHCVTHAFFADDPGPKGALAREAGDPDTLQFIGFGVPGGYEKTNFIARRFKDVAYGRIVAEHVRASDYDVVISGNTPTEAQEKIVAACGEKDSRFVLWIQDFYSIAASRILSRKIPVAGQMIGWYYRWLERRQLAKSDGIVIITEAFRALATRWGGDPAKVSRIENWGAIGNIEVRPKANDWARTQGIENDFVFLYSGTLALKHNPAFLSGIAKLRLPGVKVVVVGQGVGIDHLQKEKVEGGLDNLVVLPLQPFSELSNVLASADVLVSVVEAEAGQFSVPSKVQSYLCAERPILLAAPAANLAAMVVKRESAGVVVEPNDLDGFLASTRRLVERRPEDAELGRNGRAFAMREYDIARVADRFEEVIRAATERGRHPATTPIGGEIEAGIPGKG